MDVGVEAGGEGVSMASGVRLYMLDVAKNCLGSDKISGWVRLAFWLMRFF